MMIDFLASSIAIILLYFCLFSIHYLVCFLPCCQNKVHLHFIVHPIWISEYKTHKQHCNSKNRFHFRFRVSAPFGLYDHIFMFTDTQVQTAESYHRNRIWHTHTHARARAHLWCQLHLFTILSHWSDVRSYQVGWQCICRIHKHDTYCPSQQEIKKMWHWDERH